MDYGQLLAQDISALKVERTLVDYQRHQLALRLKTLNILERRLSNSAVRVNVLPVELIVDILSYVRAAGGYAALVTATNVFNHWRTIAVNTPKLWDVVDVGKPWAFVKLCLERSGGTEIQVYASATPASLANMTNNSDNLTWGLNQAAGRIRSINLTADSSQRLDSFLSRISTPMSILTSFDLTVTGELELMVSLPTALVQDVSNLRTLRLERVGFLWTSLPFNSLTTLHVHGMKELRMHVPTDGFLDFLDACRSLEHLSLAYTCPHHPAQLPTRVVALPNIKVLVIHDESDYTRNVLSHIQVASHTLTAFDLISSEEDVESKVLAAMLPWKFLENLRSIHALEIVLDCDRGVLDVRGRHSPADGQVLFWRHNFEGRQLPPRLLQKFLADLDSNLLSQLDLLVVCGMDASCTYEEWVQLMRRIPRVQWLSVPFIDSTAASAFFQALSQDDGSTKETVRYLCPLLRQLCVTRISPGHMWQLMALQYVRQRMERKHDLERLCLEWVGSVDLLEDMANAFTSSVCEFHVAVV